MLVTIQSPYWFAIGRRVVLSLGGWTPHVRSGFHEPEPTQGLTSSRLQGFHLLRPRIPTRSIVLLADPLSLAATYGVSVDILSSGYLDVSVPRVRFVHLCIQYTMTQLGRVAPFGNPRIAARLPAPLGLSQVPTSFIASRRQVIRRVPLVAIMPTGRRRCRCRWTRLHQSNSLFASRLISRCHVPHTLGLTSNPLGADVFLCHLRLSKSIPIEGPARFRTPTPEWLGFRRTLAAEGMLGCAVFRSTLVA